MPHFFYLARCADGSLYAGTCVDVMQRQEMHNSGKGAKYTRGRGPVEILYTETFETLSEARKREAAVKKFSKVQKEELVTNVDPKVSW
jgi:putative endonuclease